MANGVDTAGSDLLSAGLGTAGAAVGAGVASATGILTAGGAATTASSILGLGGAISATGIGLPVGIIVAGVGAIAMGIGAWMDWDQNQKTNAENERIAKQNALDQTRQFNSEADINAKALEGQENTNRINSQIANTQARSAIDTMQQGTQMANQQMQGQNIANAMSRPAQNAQRVNSLWGFGK